MYTVVLCKYLEIFNNLQEISIFKDIFDIIL